jgi:hypothetical protein
MGAFCSVSMRKNKLIHEIGENVRIGYLWENVGDIRLNNKTEVNALLIPK